MNKTLLLIMCDFLLLNLLALTHWEKAVPQQQLETPPPQVQSGNAPATKNQDMVDVMKMSLEDERKQRELLAQQLQRTQSNLQSREQNLAALQNERNQLSTTLNSTQQKAAELQQQVEQSAHDAAISRERLAQLQNELQQRQAEAERQKQQLASLTQQQQEAQQRIESLNVSVKVAEQEKQMLRDTNATLQTQVQAERQERMKVQETTSQLAHGVGQIAEQSNQLTKEIRDNRPINANTLFSDFLANRVDTEFIAQHGSLFGTVNRDKQTHTILFTDGKQTYALLHVDDTPFAVRETGPDWENVTAQFSKGGYRGTAPVIELLRVDPRIVVLPVTKEQADALGTKVYQLAADPFKFPEVVLVSSGGAGYGEVAFRLDPTEPRYVRVDNHLFKRLFGDFAPNRGDLVFSKTGELLGIMANSDYCVVLNDFTPLVTLHTGDAIKNQHTGTLFAQLDAYLKRLPQKLQ
jgi:predicted  nucleic acid-binding Zn-ribbon protein